MVGFPNNYGVFLLNYILPFLVKLSPCTTTSTTPWSFIELHGCVSGYGTFGVANVSCEP